MCFPNKDLWQGTPSTLSLIKDEVNTCFFDLESYKETPQGWELVLKRNGGIDEI
jgi:hypothetical protein